MKIYLLMLCTVITTHNIFAQSNTATSNQKKEKKEKRTTAFPDFNQSFQLEEKSDTTANASFGDFDGDGHLDILLVKGRHWPIVDRVLLGDGSGGVRKAYDLGTVADRSYTGIVADFDKDGFVDIAISNDSPDRKLVYLNDGKGSFNVGSEFGLPEWPTRNLSVADINKDGLPDLILANRGNSSSSNYICLNQGKGQFKSSCISFARYPATTITPTDFNNDGIIDLVVPHRDRGQSYIYLGSSEMDFSDAHRIPFGPPDAAIRGAAMVDFNGDNIPDVVTIDEFKGAALYVGQKDQTFLPGISLSDAKPTPYAMVVADLNSDDKMDIIVGHVNAPSKVFFNKGEGSQGDPISFGDSQGTVYGFAVGDFNEDGIPDIAAGRSDAPSILYFGQVK